MKNETTLLTAILLVTLILPLTTQAQFDSLLAVFKAPIFAMVYQVPNTIHKLGDQNDDGFDDFLIWNSRDTTMDIYFGGNPLDTIPQQKIPLLWDRGDGIPEILTIDLNDDGYDDIVCISSVGTIDADSTIYYNKRTIEIFYGGPLLDIISDLTFRTPMYNQFVPGADINFWGLNKIKDYNGDGRSELVIYEIDYRLPLPYKGRYLIYNLGSEFDTLNYKTIIAPADSLFLEPPSGNIFFKTGDLNNDGYSDFITKSFYNYRDIHGIYEEDSNFTVSRFFYGNSEADFEADKYYNSKTSPIPKLYYFIINDVDGDGKEDILMRDYENLFPYYYGWGISYGSDSLNFTIEQGINTQNEGIQGNLVELGDFNGDGYGDFTAPTNTLGANSIKLWLGEPNMQETAVKKYNSTSSGIGRMFEGVGDVNGDGADDFCIGEVKYLGGNVYISESNLYFIAGDTSIVVSVQEDVEKTLPQLFELFEAYPNPFNPTTIITYSLSIEADVTIKIIDTLGQEITTLVKGYNKTGKYSIEFNADKYGLSSGIYFVTMNINNQNTTTKKIVLLK